MLTCSDVPIHGRRQLSAHSLWRLLVIENVQNEVETLFPLLLVVVAGTAEESGVA